MPAAKSVSPLLSFKKAATQPRMVVSLVLDSLGLRRKLPFWVRILCITPALVGAVTAGLLAGTAQLREIYRALLDDGDAVRGLLGLLALLVLGTLLFCWNRDLNRMKIDRLYPDHADLRVDQHLFRLRHFKSLLCALLPLGGLALGLVFTQTHAVSEAALLAGVADRVNAARFPEITSEIEAAARLGSTALLALAVVALAAVALTWFLWVARNGKMLGRGVYGVAAAAAMVMFLLPFWRAGEPAMALAASAGTLTMVSLAAIAITAGLIVLSGFSRFSGIPMVTLVIVTGLLFTFNSLARNVSAADPGNESRSETSGPGVNDITKTFDTWLAARADRSAYLRAGKPYPVFLYAIQGGGIYAASAGATHLAVLQDYCPALTQHIFAVSAVSGGSMGTAVYHAMAAGQRQVENTNTPSCGFPVTAPMAPRIQRVVGQDHLSPLISVVLTDQVRKLNFYNWQDWLGLTGAPDRADALEASFAAAYEADLAAYPVPDAMLSGTSNRLKQKYTLTWGPPYAGPALILNATSVEAGHRVTFSPFPLQQAGDGTLFSFSEIDQGADVTESTLIKAAGVSARIPGLVPAWAINHVDPKDPGRTQRWSFVDGGYADGSGAATAYDIFRVLEKHIRTKQLDVDLRLALMTDSVAAPKFEDLEGSTFGDAILTVSTLMQIRRLLSVRAVTEAVTEVRNLEPDAHQTPGSERVFVSHLEHGTFPLSLGWRISPSTDAIVRLLVGRPDLFPESQCSDLTRNATVRQRAGAGEDDAELKIARAAETIRTNSCTMQRMIKLVAGR